MFDIGATELFVIGVVALIVIGPERLPRVAKTVGHLFGRMQRYVADVKADINREIELEELRKLKSTMEDAARSFEQSVSNQVNYIESEVKQAGEEIEKQAQQVVEPIKGLQLMPSTESLKDEAVAAQDGGAPVQPQAEPSSDAPASAPEEKQA